MTQPRYRTAIIGFGKIGAEYADDRVMAAHYPVATHAQALENHPRFDWCAVVDPRPESLYLARERWDIRSACLSIEELVHRESIEVAVLATPPEARIDAIALLPDLRAVIVEKPLGRNLAEAAAFMAACTRRNIAVEVNYWRRFDESFRRLALGGIEDAVGIPQAVFGVYGNGLRNNGSHMVDFCRMLFGEVSSAVACGAPVRHRQAPIAGDIDVAFQLQMESGLRIVFQSVDFAHYRENSLDIWGERGRLQLVQEGLRQLHAGTVPNRAMSGEREVPSDAMTATTTTVGRAFEELYRQLGDVLDNGARPVCPLDSALRSERIVEQIFSSAQAVDQPSGNTL